MDNVKKKTKYPCNTFEKGYEICEKEKKDKQSAMDIQTNEMQLNKRRKSGHLVTKRKCSGRKSGTVQRTKGGQK